MWRRIVFRWEIGDWSGAGYAAIAAIPVIAVGTIITLARSTHAPGPVERSDLAQFQARELQCLAENIYYEARGEPIDGQYAVAEVTLNRVRSPRYANTICEVVYDTRWDTVRRRYVGHFSWTGLQHRNDPWGPAWEQAMKIATVVYNDSYMPLVPEALHYHAVTVRPSWARHMHSVAQIGNHVFYR